MEAREDVLQPVQPHNLHKLLQVLEHQQPLSTTAYNWLSTQARWSRHLPTLRVHVLCPRGDWSTGTLVAYADGLAGEGRQYGVVYAPEGPEGERLLEECLLRTRAVPWRSMLHFSGVLQSHVEILSRAVRAAGVTLPAMQPEGVLMLVPRELALNLEDPQLTLEGARLIRLGPQHLEDVWFLRNAFADCFKPVLQAVLQFNLGYGVMVRSADGSEQLASMILELEHGGVGMARTHPSFTRRRLQHVVSAPLFREIARQGRVPAGFTWTSNQAIVQGGRLMLGLEPAARVVRFDVNPGRVTGPTLGMLTQEAVARDWKQRDHQHVKLTNSHL